MAASAVRGYMQHRERVAYAAYLSSPEGQREQCRVELIASGLALHKRQDTSGYSAAVNRCIAEGHFTVATNRRKAGARLRGSPLR
jgi:hypothetical protein